MGRVFSFSVIVEFFCPPPPFLCRQCPFPVFGKTFPAAAKLFSSRVPAKLSPFFFSRDRPTKGCPYQTVAETGPFRLVGWLHFKDDPRITSFFCFPIFSDDFPSPCSPAFEPVPSPSPPSLTRSDFWGFFFCDLLKHHTCLSPLYV